MGIKFTNNASATLAASINSTVTTISVTTGQGARFPTLMAGDYFFATLVDSSNNMEIIKVTNRVTDTMTVVRAQDGTIGRSFLANDRVELRPVAASFNALQEFTPSGTIAANTLSGAIVELDSEKAAINSPTFTGTPAAPTAAAGTNTTQLATTAFTTTAITNERSATTTLTNKTISGASNTLTVRLDQTDVVNTLPVVRGGTGQTSYTNGQLLIGNTTGNTLAKATLTAGTGISITNGAGSITIAYTGATNVQTFNNPDTWTKPASGSMVRIQVWGGGGGGGSWVGGTNAGGGGGGGAYNERWMLLSDLPSTVSVTVGAGGAGFNGNGNGGNGGNSSFGSYVTAYGGGGGRHNYESRGGGINFGGGGGVFTAGALNASGAGGVQGFWGGTNGACLVVTQYMSGGYPYDTYTQGSSSDTVFAGGGGGSNSIYGTGARGLSLYGGNGGAAGQNGTAPGGGGGGAYNVVAGSGAAGRVIVTVF